LTLLGTKEREQVGLAAVQSAKLSQSKAGVGIVGVIELQQLKARDSACGGDEQVRHAPVFRELFPSGMTPDCARESPVVVVGRGQ